MAGDSPTSFGEVDLSQLGKKFKSPPIGPSVLIATFALNLLALALPLVVLQIFDRVIPFAATETLFFLFIGLCVVAILEFVLKTARTVLLGSSGKAFEIALCETFMQSTLNADPEAFSKTTPATHLDQFSAIAQLRGFYAGQGRILAIDLPFTFVFVAMIGLIGGWLILVPLGCMLALLLFRTSLQAAQRSIFDQRRVLDGRRYSFLAEALSQIRTLKANTMEPQILRRYELLQQQTTDTSQKIIRFSGLSQSFGALFSQFAVAAMGLFGSYLIIIGQIGIAELAACMLLNGRTVQPMLKALGLWVQSENISAAKVKFQTACAIPTKPALPNMAEKLHGDIEFRDVGLSFDETRPFVFRNLTQSVAHGESLIVTGNGGAGKSSFLKLILGELQPSEGEVLIDGLPARKYLATRGEGGIGYIDHKPAIFAGTVLENISAFGDGETIKRALELSEQFGVEKYINRLPLGYNTQVLGSPTLTNNRAAIQGICLVRALVLRPKILLTNNIGAALDRQARAEFGQIINGKMEDMTLVISDDVTRFGWVADHQIDLDDRREASLRAWDADAPAEKNIPQIPNKTAAA